MVLSCLCNQYSWVSSSRREWDVGLDWIGFFFELSLGWEGGRVDVWMYGCMGGLLVV